MKSRFSSHFSFTLNFNFKNAIDDSTFYWIVRQKRFKLIRIKAKENPAQYDSLTLVYSESRHGLFNKFKKKTTRFPSTNQIKEKLQRKIFRKKMQQKICQQTIRSNFKSPFFNSNKINLNKQNEIMKEIFFLIIIFLVSHNQRYINRHFSPSRHIVA